MNRVALHPSSAAFQPSDLTVAPVQSDAEAELASSILIEAADWLASRGQPLWSPENLTPAKIRPAASVGTLYLAKLHEQAAGTFLILFEDPTFWPESKAGEALYLHKLAVRRWAAGQGLARALLGFALGEARAAGRPLLRLDCALRPKLYALYESAGFQARGEGSVGPFMARLYERPTSL